MDTPMDTPDMRVGELARLAEYREQGADYVLANASFSVATETFASMQRAMAALDTEAPT